MKQHSFLVMILHTIHLRLRGVRSTDRYLEVQLLIRARKWDKMLFLFLCWVGVFGGVYEQRLPPNKKIWNRHWKWEVRIFLERSLNMVGHVIRVRSEWHTKIGNLIHVHSVLHVSWSEPSGFIIEDYDFTGSSIQHFSKACHWKTEWSRLWGYNDHLVLSIVLLCI